MRAIVGSLRVVLTATILAFLIAFPSFASEQECSSEADCTAQCSAYASQLNSDPTQDFIYSCGIESITEEFGQTSGEVEHTTFFCLCTPLQRKPDGADPGEPPFMVRPINPDLPGGRLPPSIALPPNSDWLTCLADAMKLKRKLEEKCSADANAFLDDNIEHCDASENREFAKICGKLFVGEHSRMYAQCMENADQRWKAEKARCTRENALRDIRDAVKNFKQFRD